MSVTAEPPGREAVSHCLVRIQELGSVLTALEIAWTGLDDDARKAIVSDVRRGLVDAACSIDPD